MIRFIDRDAIEKMIAAAERQIQILTDKRSHLQSEIDDASEALASLKSALACGERFAIDPGDKLSSEPDDKTKFEQIVDFFLARENEPATIAEIASTTGISRSSVSAVLYRTHKDKFSATEGRPNKWWMDERCVFADPSDHSPPPDSFSPDIPF